MSKLARFLKTGRVRPPRYGLIAAGMLSRLSQSFGLGTDRIRLERSDRHQIVGVAEGETRGLTYSGFFCP